MEPGGSMQHSQGLSNNPYPEPNQPNSPHWYLSLQSPQFPALIPISSRFILILSFHLRLGLPKGLFLVGLPNKILKALLPSSNLDTCPAYLNLLESVAKHRVKFCCFQLCCSCKLCIWWRHLRTTWEDIFFVILKVSRNGAEGTVSITRTTEFLKIFV